MRKVKLQMQTSIDGFVAGANGEMDWMVWDWGDDLMNYVSDLTKPVDLILLGRNLAVGFIESWTARLNNPETADDSARWMVETPKIVFSRSLENPGWEHTSIAGGDLTEEITKLKQSEGGDIIVYGGGGFVSSLIKYNLIDEYHLFVNPVALGKGMTIFDDLNVNLKLRLLNSQTFSCGIAVLVYEPFGN